MTDLEKRADEYADKRAVAYNMPKSSFVIPLLKVAYKTGATQETALLSQHILDLQKDKGNLTDRVRELEQQIEKMKWHDLQKDPSDLPKDYKTMCICLSDFGTKYEPIPRVCIGYCDSLGWSDYMGSSLYSTVRYWCELPQS